MSELPVAGDATGVPLSFYVAWEQKLLANPLVASTLRQLFANWMGLPSCPPPMGCCWRPITMSRSE
jgi:hypothetical protein